MADRLHLKLLPAYPPISGAAQHGKSRQGTPSEALDQGQIDAFSVRRDDPHRGDARRRKRRFSRRRRSGAALHLDRGAVLLLSLQLRDALGDLRPRPPEEGCAGRAPRPHGGAGAGGADGEIDGGFRQAGTIRRAVPGASASLAVVPANAGTPSVSAIALIAALRPPRFSNGSL